MLWSIQFPFRINFDCLLAFVCRSDYGLMKESMFNLAPCFTKTLSCQSMWELVVQIQWRIQENWGGGGGHQRIRQNFALNNGWWPFLSEGCGVWGVGGGGGRTRSSTHSVKSVQCTTVQTWSHVCRITSEIHELCVLAMPVSVISTTVRGHRSPWSPDRKPHCPFGLSGDQLTNTPLSGKIWWSSLLMWL